MMPDKNLTVAQVAALLGYSEKHIYRLVRTKHLPHYKPAGRLYFNLQDIQEWLINSGTGYKKVLRKRYESRS